MSDLEAVRPGAGEARRPGAQPAGSAHSVTVIGAGASAAAIALRCSDAGLGVRIAARRAAAAQALAQELQSHSARPVLSAPVDIGSPAELDGLLKETQVVINTAGPFVQTAAPIVAAALHVGTAYVDVANELRAVQSLLALDAHARKAGATLVTGAGYGVAAAETLAGHLARALGEIDTIEVANLPIVNTHSAGVVKTALAALPDGGRVIRGGRLERRRLGSPRRQLSIGGHRVGISALPTGDLLAVARACSAAHVTFYSGELPGGALLQSLLGLFGPAMRSARVRAAAQRLAQPALARLSDVEEGPARGGRSITWGRARTKDGRWEEAWLLLGEGYEVTAQIAAACALRVARAPLPGACTPAGVGVGAQALAGAQILRGDPEHPGDLQAALRATPAPPL
jgi:short subunit dehydrogenase-like uncharacterized protein